MTWYQAGAFITPVDGSWEAIKEYKILSSSKGGVMWINGLLDNFINV